MATELLAPRCWEWLQIDIAQSSVRNKNANAMKYTLSLTATLSIGVNRFSQSLTRPTRWSGARG